MSRTKRKHRLSFNMYYHERLQWYYTPYLAWFKEDKPSIQEVKREYEKETRSKNWIDFTVPRSFRNTINRKRRRWDKQEIWKELNLEQYENLCSRWNGKSGDHWDFW